VRIVVLFVLAIATSLDSLGVGVAYGLSGTRVRLSAHVCISAIMMAITWASVGLGNHLSRYLPDSLTHLLSAAFFCGIGLWILWPLLRKKRRTQQSDPPDRAPTLTQVLEDPQTADRDGSRDIDLREAVLLGFALSLNNIGGGVSAGLIRLSAFWMAFLSVFFNVLCLTGGHLVGRWMGATRLSRYAQILSGVLLVMVGLWQLH
jgi:putative sporulation protein YtaF